MAVPKKPPISVKMVTAVKVKVIGFDDRGKVKLSMKRVDQETGADLEAALLKPLNRPQQESNKTKKGGAIGTAFCLSMVFTA